MSERSAITYADQSLRLALRVPGQHGTPLTSALQTFWRMRGPHHRKLAYPFPLRPPDLIFLVLEMEATDLHMLERLSLLENVKLKSMLLLD